jgi:polyhydroxyalkanoate synthesis repressor PhaR
MITIKKYDNRRLYDTSASRYVTLEEVADTIRAGHDVEVVHADTGEELTQRVLARIILESRGAARLLPVPLLTRLIRMGDDQLAEFFGQYMSWALELYLRFKDRAEQWAPYNPFSEDGLAGPELFVRMFLERIDSSSSPPEQRPSVPDVTDVEPPSDELPPEVEPPPVETNDEVERLREEIDELRETIESMRDE